MHRHSSFSSRLSLSLLLVTSVLVSCALGVIGYCAYDYMKEDAQESSIERMNDVIREMHALLSRGEAVLNSTSWIVRDNIDDTGYLLKVMSNLVSAYKVIDGSTIVYDPGYASEEKLKYNLYSYITPEGEVRSELAEAGILSAHPVTDMVMDVLRTGQPGKSEPYYMDNDGVDPGFFIVYAVPVKDRSGRTLAAFCVKISLEMVTQMLTQWRPYENSFSGLQNADKFYVSTSDSAGVTCVSLDVFPGALRDSLCAGTYSKPGVKASCVDFTGLDGIRKFAVIGPLSQSWSICTVSRYADVFDTAILLSRLILGLTAVLILLIFFITRWTVRRYSQPITQFTFTALNISKGNFDVRIPQLSSSDNELRRLQGALSNMVSALKVYIREMKTAAAANERYESELNVARDIQKSILPTDFPQDEVVDMYADVIPAREVGGDLYLFRDVPDKLYFMVGDVSGKGVPAALYVSTTRVAMLMANISGLDAAATVRAVNDAVCVGNGMNMFITMFFAGYDRSTGELRYCNAGHNPIVVAPPDGNAYFLRARPNLAAGLFEGFQYEQESIFLQKGTRLVLYTDGVTEAEAADKSQWGEGRLLDFVSNADPGMPSEDFVKALEAAVREFTAGNTQNDDITVMSIRIK